jgi:hypothetical protein
MMKNIFLNRYNSRKYSFAPMGQIQSPDYLIDYRHYAPTEQFMIGISE